MIAAGTPGAPALTVRESVDLAVIARDVIARHTEEALRAGSAIDFDHSGDTSGSWDRTRLEQVVANLLANAIKYGEGKQISVRVEGRGGAVRLEVRDRGIGISEDDRPRIFGRFERAVLDRHYGGFGLGLWIVRELVEAHHGEVDFVSAPNAGSTFTVIIPREEST